MKKNVNKYSLRNCALYSEKTDGIHKTPLAIHRTGNPQLMIEIFGSRTKLMSSSHPPADGLGYNFLRPLSDTVIEGFSTIEKWTIILGIHANQSYRANDFKIHAWDFGK